jgi:hypothetical protein
MAVPAHILGARADRARQGADLQEPGADTQGGPRKRACSSQSSSAAPKGLRRRAPRAAGSSACSRRAHRRAARRTTCGARQRQATPSGQATPPRSNNTLGVRQHRRPRSPRVPGPGPGPPSGAPHRGPRWGLVPRCVMRVSPCVRGAAIFELFIAFVCFVLCDVWLLGWGNTDKEEPR